MQASYLVSVPSQDKLGGCARKSSSVKMVAMAEMGAPISLDGGSPSRLLVCLFVLSSFCTRKPEDGEMYLLVPAHPGFS